MTVRVGDSLGQYVIVDQIGKGGMATVFRARQESLSREVAVKVLPDFFAEDPSFHARFRQEAMAIARLRHPNILTVFDSGEQDGVAYIVTELVDGGTLADKLGKPLPLGECVSLATTIGQALDYAHTRGMIHRDIKPSNILIAHDGTPILSDFGLARITGGTDGETPTRLTISGTSLGTPEYMAPEQVSSSIVGPAADIYALAVTLYEMLTGTVPYSADTPIAVIAARMRDPLPLPRVRNPALSEAVQSVLLKGLAEDPADRYRSAGEMANALRAAGTVVGSEPVRAAGTASRRLPLAAAAVLVGVAVLALVWRGQQQQHAPIVASRTDTIAPVIKAPATADTAAQSQAQAVATSSAATTVPAPSTITKPIGASSGASEPEIRKSERDGLPAHGRLLYSIGTSAAEIAALPSPRAGDAIALKNGMLELTVSTDTGVSIKLPVEGVGDFVAVLRYAAVEQKPSLSFLFHLTPQGQGYAVRLPTQFRLLPAAAGAPANGPHVCCQPFDIFLAPWTAAVKSIFTGAEPVTLPAARDEEQTVVVSAVGPQIVVWAGGQEIARVTDSSFRAGAMRLGTGRIRTDGPATLRLRAFDLYEAPASRAHLAEVPHGKLLFTMADHLATIAQTRQSRPELAIAVKEKALEFTVGADGAALATLPVGGISDFVAVIHMAATNFKPLFQLRFHRGPQGEHVVQLPAFLRLGPPETGARNAGSHVCCADVDVFAVPANGGPTLFSGLLPRAVPASANEESVIVIAVQGPIVVVYENGLEIARATLDAQRAGGMSLQVLARGRQLPAVLRVNALEIYEPATER